MDFHANVHSQCQPNVTMDHSPVNADFYDEVSAKPVKQEPAYDLEQSAEFGLEFFPSEESIDLGAYIGGRFDTPNTGDESVRQLGSFASQVNDGGAPVLSALQAPEFVDLTSPQQPGGAAVMHYQNLLQPTTNVQMNVSQSHQVIGEQIMHNGHTDSIVPESYIPAGFAVEQVIDESQDVHSTSTSCASSPGLPTISETADSPSGTTTGSGGSKRKRPAPPPGTHEYKQKRERNNIAVRKSRLKTKQKNRELQDKVGELQGENSSLKKRVEMLTKELTVLKSLFTNVGKPAPARLSKAVE